MVTDYTDATKVSNFLNRPLTQYEVDMLTVVIPAIKKYIDSYVGSNFSEVASSTRYYDGGGSTVDIDPCTEVGTISYIDNFDANNYDYILFQNYVLEPQNENVKREIVRRDGCFPDGERRIAVTAKFSEYDGGIPADISMVATRLAAAVLISGKVVAQGNVSSESLEGHSVSYNTKTTLDDASSADPFITGVLKQRREVLVY